MVLDLKKRYGIDTWCGVLFGKGAYEFVQNQKDIKYDPLLVNDFLAIEADDEVVDEEYLNLKEKEYGHPYLWQEFLNDRHIAIDWPRQFYPYLNPNKNYYQIKQQFQIRIRKIEEMLDKAKPDFVIFTDAGAMTLNLLYYIAKKRNIPVLVLGINRPFSLAGVTDNLFGTFNTVDKLFADIKSGKHQSNKKNDAVALIEGFRNKPIKPYYILPSESWNKFGQSTVRKAVLFAKNFVRKCLDRFDTSFPNIYDYSPWDFVRHNYLLWHNARSNFTFDTPDPKEDYVFFPLHQEPELNLSMFAPYFVDQGWTALAIAQSLPLNCKLYVKDHPLMAGYRDKKFYKRLKKFPNIKIIDPKADSIELIRHSKIVTTISGTAGWEALFLKKSVVTFGSIYYNAISFVRKCTVISELPDLIADTLKNYKHNEEELVQYVSALLEDSFKIDFTKLFAEKNLEEIQKNPDLTLMSDHIMKYLGTLKK